MQLLIGYYNGWKTNPANGHSVALSAPSSRMLRVELGEMLMFASGNVSLEVSTIPNTGAAHLVAPLPMYKTVVPLRGDGTLELGLNATLNAVLIVEIRSMI